MTAMTTPRHAITRATESLHAVLDEVADAPVWSMSPAETAATLQSLTRAAARLAELEARVAHHAETVDVAAATGASSTANWWAHQTRQTRPEAHRKTRLAAALASGDHDPVRDALATGDLLVDQAHAVLDAVTQLPDGLDHDVVEAAESYLVGEGRHHDARTLRHLGRHLLHVIDPDLADAHEAELLEQEEAAAAAATRLTLLDDGHGKSYGRFTLPSAQGAMLKKMLLALAAPKHRTATQDPAEAGATVERRPTAERLGQAFCELIERYPTDKLPHAGGLSATAVVLMPLDTLMGGLQAAHLDTGEAISPSQARRIACEAGIIPAVLGGRSQVLDLGRKRRFHTEAMRIAKTIEDGGCTAEGCDQPPGLTHMHHDIRWADGGPTNTDNARLLCAHHHRRAHDPTYRTEPLPNGKLRYHRRT